MNINADLDRHCREGLRAKAHAQSTDFIPTSSPRRWSAPLWATTSCRCCWWRVLFGIGLAMVGEPARPVLNFLEALTTPVFKVVGIVMKVAPSARLAPWRSPSASSAWGRS